MGKPALSLLICRNLPIFEQLQLEEALLRVDNRNWCLINSGTPPAIVMGISGKPEQLIDPKILAEKKLAIIRRFSGGGTVYVDHGTHFVTWICNAKHVGVGCCPAKIHEWGAHFFSSAMPTLDVLYRENDYVIGDSKWGGNAQYLCRDRWLHHTSILWDYDEAKMQCLLVPQKMPKYRQNRSHADFLCRLSDYLPCRTDFERGLIQEIHDRFSVKETTLEEVTPLLKAPHRKATAFIHS